MSVGLYDKIKDYLFDVACIGCGDFLFLLSVEKVDDEESKGIVYCPSCERKNEAYFHE